MRSLSLPISITTLFCISLLISSSRPFCTFIPDCKKRLRLESSTADVCVRVGGLILFESVTDGEVECFDKNLVQGGFVVFARDFTRIGVWIIRIHCWVMLPVRV